MVSAQPGIPQTPFHPAWPHTLGPWAGSTGQRADEVPASLSKCVHCVQAQRKHTLSPRLCVPLVHTHKHPGRGLARSTFLGCTSISPVAMKVPGPHWVWLLTSNPSSSTGFFTVHLKDCFCPSWTPPPSLLSSFLSSLQGFLPNSSIWPPPPLSSSLQHFPLFLNCLLTSFTLSFIQQIVLESCCMPGPEPVSRTPKMN